MITLAEKHHPSDRPGFLSSESFGLTLPFHFVSAVITPDRQGAMMLRAIATAFGIDTDGNVDTGLINVFYWMGDDGMLRAVVVPRLSHRPHHYLEDEPDRIVVGPGAIDMAGLMITPRPQDYERLDARLVREIYSEVAFADRLPEPIRQHFGL